MRPIKIRERCVRLGTKLSSKRSGPHKRRRVKQAGGPYNIGEQLSLVALDESLQLLQRSLSSVKKPRAQQFGLCQSGRVNTSGFIRNRSER